MKCHESTNPNHFAREAAVTCTTVDAPLGALDNVKDKVTARVANTRDGAAPQTVNIHQGNRAEHAFTMGCTPAIGPSPTELGGEDLATGLDEMQAQP